MLLCGCIPLQDCGVVASVNVQGLVVDADNNPVSEAKISIVSQGTFQCPNSTPITDIDLVTDENGEFSHIILVIAEDDTVSIKVEAEGYTIYQTTGTYTIFANDIKIVLYK
jgi:hypothetical protein